MVYFLITVHVLVSLFLIFVVLVQGGRGADLGAAFGGSSQTLFGGRGAATFLGKLTTIMAALFMVTSLVLTIVSVKGGGSVVRQPAAQKQAAPPAGAMPSTPAPGMPVPEAPLPEPPAKTPAGQ